MSLSLYIAEYFCKSEYEYWKGSGDPDLSQGWERTKSGKTWRRKKGMGGPKPKASEDESGADSGKEVEVVDASSDTQPVSADPISQFQEENVEGGDAQAAGDLSEEAAANDDEEATRENDGNQKPVNDTLTEDGPNPFADTQEMDEQSAEGASDTGEYEQVDDSEVDEGTTDEGTTDEGTTDEGTTDEGTTDEGTTDEEKPSNHVEAEYTRQKEEYEAAQAELDQQVTELDDKTKDLDEKIKGIDEEYKEVTELGDQLDKLGEEYNSSLKEYEDKKESVKKDEFALKERSAAEAAQKKVEKHESTAPTKVDSKKRAAVVTAVKEAKKTEPKLRKPTKNKPITPEERKAHSRSLKNWKARNKRATAAAAKLEESDAAYEKWSSKHAKLKEDHKKKAAKFIESRRSERASAKKEIAKLKQGVADKKAEFSKKNKNEYAPKLKEKEAKLKELNKQKDAINKQKDTIAKKKASLSSKEPQKPDAAESERATLKEDAVRGKANSQVDTLKQYLIDNPDHESSAGIQAAIDQYQKLSSGEIGPKEQKALRDLDAAMQPHIKDSRDQKKAAEKKETAKKKEEAKKKEADNKAKAKAQARAEIRTQRARAEKIRDQIRQKREGQVKDRMLFGKLYTSYSRGSGQGAAMGSAAADPYGGAARLTNVVDYGMEGAMGVSHDLLSSNGKTAKTEQQELEERLATEAGPGSKHEGESVTTESNTPKDEQDGQDNQEKETSENTQKSLTGLYILL